MPGELRAGRAPAVEAAQFEAAAEPLAGGAARLVEGVEPVERGVAVEVEALAAQLGVAAPLERPLFERGDVEAVVVRRRRGPGGQQAERQQRRTAPRQRSSPARGR
jgi:hypothetical protein